MDLHFDFTEVRKMASTYTGGAQIVRDETRTAITRSVIQIEADAKKRVPKDTHHLQRSITHEVTANTNSITGRAGTNVDYAEAVEKGRSAGEKMPPPGALLGWMRRHGIELGHGPTHGQVITFVHNRYYEVELLVARKIGRRGIRPRPYMKPAMDVNRLKISRDMDQVLRRVAQRLAASR